MNTYTITVRREVIQTYDVTGTDITDAIANLHDNKGRKTSAQAVGAGTVQSVVLRSGHDVVVKPVTTATKAQAKRQTRRYTRGTFGPHNPMPPEVAKEIFTMVNSGIARKEVAKAYGISSATVDCIKYGLRRYKDIVAQAA